VVGEEDDRSWACGFSYRQSWEEAMNRAITGVMGYPGNIPNFTFDLWTTQGVLPNSGYDSVLGVGFYFTPWES